jgi:hypothetical protein
MAKPENGRVLLAERIQSRKSIISMRRSVQSKAEPRPNARAEPKGADILFATDRAYLASPEKTYRTVIFNTNTALKTSDLRASYRV